MKGLPVEAYLGFPGRGEWLFKSRNTGAERKMRRTLGTQRSRWFLSWLRKASEWKTALQHVTICLMISFTIKRSNLLPCLLHHILLDRLQIPSSFSSSSSSWTPFACPSPLKEATIYLLDHVFGLCFALLWGGEGGVWGSVQLLTLPN